ncbi:MAG: FAD:protein FMN transferase, partial [Pseudomonadota bacterium]
MFSTALRGTVAAALVSLALPVLADSHTRHVDNVLGTSMDLSIVGVRTSKADKAFAAATAEAARLEALLSDYQPDSEVSRLNRERTLPSLSPELSELIGHCRRWETSTSGAFSCKLGKARAVWRQAVIDDAIPDRRTLRAMARQLRSIELPEPTGGAYTLPDTVELDVNGLAKGYVIDKVLAAMRGVAPAAIGIKVDIGGDGLYSGLGPDNEPWRVGLTNADTDSEAPNGVVAVQNAAVAASGHDARGMTIRRRQFSHILAARDAWPTQHQVASYVTAPTAVAADVVATLAASLAPADSLEWVGAQADIEALLVLPSGRQIASTGWRQNEVLADAGPLPLLSVTYEIP